MPTKPLSDEALALLRRPNPAVIMAVRAEGKPVSVTTLYLVDADGVILVNMVPGI